ncbi:MAG: hypothetical protein HY097_10900 [Nitrospinae bacterium]|nr:hypothetical protein [Nitrospinota bacterium]MBI3814706.1 hypothetical protein [Nitrospinota bacterium]
MKKTFILLFFSIALLSYSAAFAVEVAPRISDREIIESLAELKAGQSALQQQINDLKESANKRFDDTNRRIDDLKESNNKQFDGVNKRLDTLQWLLGLFITVALSLMGIMGRILWNQQKKLTQIETSLEAQKEELSFLKTLMEKLQTLIEKLLPPRGVL